MIDRYNSENPKDFRAKEMVRKAFEFAMDNGLNVSYDSGTNGMSFFFPKKGTVSDYFTYLTWDSREADFNKMMNEARKLVGLIRKS